MYVDSAIAAFGRTRWPNARLPWARVYHRAGQCKMPTLGVVAERSEVLVFVLLHHTHMIANQDGSVYSTRCSAAYAVHREGQWQRRSKHTELES
jgi:hypothetical protein